MAAYKKTRVRGLAKWRPQAKTKKLLAQILAVLDEYAGHLPLAIRQIFYRLVATVDYPKTEQAYETLLDKLNRARRAGMIPFSAIRDDGLVAVTQGGFDGVPHFWKNVANWAEEYRRDRQEGQLVAIEVWVEAAGMVPQIVSVVERYGIPVFSSGGFDSTTAKHDAAQRAIAREVPTVVLHIGDHDPSGQSVFDSASEDVITMVSDLGRPGIVEFRRIAVTPEQVVQYGLPEAPAKSTDRRGDWTGGTVQAEALDPATLADIVRQAVESEIDLTIFDEVLLAEEDDRDELRGTLAELRSNGRAT